MVVWWWLLSNIAIFVIFFPSNWKWFNCNIFSRYQSPNQNLNFAKFFSLHVYILFENFLFNSRLTFNDNSSRSVIGITSYFGSEKKINSFFPWKKFQPRNRSQASISCEAAFASWRVFAHSSSSLPPRQAKWRHSFITSW